MKYLSKSFTIWDELRQNITQFAYLQHFFYFILRRAGVMKTLLLFSQRDDIGIKSENQTMQGAQ